MSGHEIKTARRTIQRAAPVVAPGRPGARGPASPSTSRPIVQQAASSTHNRQGALGADPRAQAKANRAAPTARRWRHPGCPRHDAKWSAGHRSPTE